MSGSRWVSLVGFGLAAFAAQLSSGCGSNPATVSGTVMFNGKVVSSGSVILYCEDKQIVRGLIGVDGRYSIPNVPRGTATVVVQSHTRTPDGLRIKQSLPPTTGGPLPPSLEGAEVSKVPPLPRRYGIPEESGLSVVVDRDDLRYDIDLTP